MKSRYLYLIIILLYLSVSAPISKVLAVEKGTKATVRATIPGRVNVRIFGYTAAYAIVQVSGIRVFAQVSSDRTGYFIIDPLSISKEAKEICLTTIDSEKRSGFPICVNLPDTDKSYEIGPILLSPTLSLSKGKMLQKEKAQAQGFTIPNSKIIVSFFVVPKNTIAQKVESIFAKIINPIAEAADLPLISGFSDKRGAYSINLPTSKSIGYRMFVKALFKDAPTPKSQTLAFKIDALTEYWIRTYLPRLLLFLSLLSLMYFMMGRLAKGRPIRVWLSEFNETRWRPFAVRKGLQLRRLWYNFRAYLRSNRI